MEIGLGDIVTLGWSDGYADGTVVEVHKDGTVDVFRPLTHTQDFSIAGRSPGSKAVMYYIGFEIVKNANPARLKVIRKYGPVR
jgi:hypothetical protein